MSELIYPEASLDEAMERLSIDVFFVNLCHNLTSFTINYRPDIRQLFENTVDRTQEIQNSPFNIKNKA